MRIEQYTEFVSGIAVLTGFLAAALPFVWSVSATLTWGTVAAGLGIALLAAWATYRTSEGEVVHGAVPALAMVGGLWLVAAPFGIGVGVTAFRWSSLVLGLLALVLSGVTLYAGAEFGVSKPAEPAA